MDSVFIGVRTVTQKSISSLYLLQNDLCNEEPLKQQKNYIAKTTL